MLNKADLADRSQTKVIFFYLLFGSDLGEYHAFCGSRKGARKYVNLV